MKYHEGMAFQAAALDGVSNAAVDAPRWDAHSRSASAVGRSLAKLCTKMSSFRYNSDAPAGAPGYDVVKNSWAGGSLARTELAPLSWPLVSPGAGAAASTYTNAFTLASPAAALVITAPP